MTDRELLELAAKAAGIDARRLPNAWPHRFDDDQWDPLIDNGDALRLAVKCGICFGPNLDGDRAVAYGKNGRNIVELHGTDPYAATRRAIVRAAAEIGRDKT
jgi:hypothetical protein